MQIVQCYCCFIGGATACNCCCSINGVVDNISNLVKPEFISFGADCYYCFNSGATAYNYCRSIDGVVEKHHLGNCLQLLLFLRRGCKTKPIQWLPPHPRRLRLRPPYCLTTLT